MPLVNATRKIVRERISCGAVDIVERQDNLGCAESITAGVNHVLRQSDRVVVVEDDLVVSSKFLKYMNAALDLYRDNRNVMHVSGYQYPGVLDDFPTALLLPITNSWGWGTWRRAWKCYRSDFPDLASIDRWWWRRFHLDSLGALELRKAIEQARGRELDTWAVRWSYSVFLERGLAVFPRRSLVSNIGFDGSGTHRMNQAYEIPPADVMDECEMDFPKPVNPGLLYLNRYAQQISGGVPLSRRVMNHLRGPFGWRHSLARFRYMTGTA